MWRPGKKRRDARAGEAARLADLELENARLVERIAAAQQRFRGLARAIWRVEEDERRRIARELHDNLGQMMTALRLRIERLPPGEDRDAAAELATQALADMRNLSRLLRPAVLDDLGLFAALQWLARNFRENAGLPVKAEGGLDIRLDEDSETMLFRVAQEALTNTVKHANATRADLTLTRVGDRVEMRIRDNGDGFDASAIDADPENAGVGHFGMRDRVAFFGGEFVVSSAPGRGATITVVLPVMERKKEDAQ